MMRFRASSGSDDSRTLKRTITVVLLRLACWPPGPPEVENLSSISESGINHSPSFNPSMSMRIRVDSEVSKSPGLFVVVLGPEMGDEFFTHQVTQIILELGRLDEQVILRV